MNSKTCPNCRAPVSEDAAFCDNCGAPLIDSDKGELRPPGHCPNCGAAVGIDDLFCDQCGHDLLPAPGFPTAPQRPAVDTGSGEGDGPPLNPHLLIEPTGMPLMLAAEQDAYVIGREDPSSGSYPDVDLVPYGGEEGGVSRRHAKILQRDGAFFIEDLNSVNYTFVNRQKLAVGIAHPLRDGDEIRLGRVFMRFKTR
jgi:hypothetical protein